MVKQVLGRVTRAAGGLVLGSVVAALVICSLIAVAVVVVTGLVVGCAQSSGEGRMFMRWRL